MWTGDTENQPSHDAAFDKLTARIHPGAIVLLHNTSQTNGEIFGRAADEVGGDGIPFCFIAAGLCTSPVRNRNTGLVCG